MPLKNAQILSTGPGMHVDGNDLYLNVTPQRAKSRISRYQFKGKRCEMGFSSLVGLPAPEARALAARLRANVANGIDPLAQRHAAREAEKAAKRAAERELRRQQHTFRAAAETHSSLANNPKLKKPAETADHADGWGWYMAGQPFHEAWRLVIALDANADNARHLSHLYDHLCAARACSRSARPLTLVSTEPSARCNAADSDGKR
ncbi:integrase arm-type DNA-binding domain-containing protein [Novosphingobium sp.]|uniref:integrase arm-type DNA-binding domain-containing protein n=1 Tax=Novosphingobium sp. TaxID=1874826 RepID=UPI001D2F3A1C|nr:integrase arm-type DNA-binding domain-containing protein [Novosphingobium sp.]MBX9665638.1 Arm DNA-binding domain-containing protein [Novosphingobium sp.]